MIEDIRKLVRDREKQASKLSNIEIWRQVVLNAIAMDAPINMKASILLQAIPDIGVIFKLLKKYNDENRINDRDYHDILELCVKKLEANQQMVDFDPLTYEGV